MITVIVKQTKKLVVVNENCNCSDDIGVIDELNATSLNFDFPETIEGIPIEKFNKEIIFQNASGTVTDELTSDVFKLTKKHTKYPQIRIQVRLTTLGMEWLSFPTLFSFAEHLTSMESTIESNTPDKTVDESEYITIYGHDSLPEVSDLRSRGEIIPVVIPRGEIVKINLPGEVQFAEGKILIVGNVQPTITEGTNIDEVTIYTPSVVIENWTILLGDDAA